MSASTQHKIHGVVIIIIDRLISFREITAVYTDNEKKSINIFFGQMGIANFRAGGIYGNYRVLYG
jgi:hypothetical protein